MKISIQNNIKMVAMATLLSTAAVSCSSDYLDTLPTHATGSADAVSTTANAMKALNGIAKLMTTQHGAYGQGFAGENNIIAHYENYPSETYFFNAYAAGWAPIHNQEFHKETNSKYLEYAWYYYYSLIGGANSIIANIDDAVGPDSEKQFIKASALTFRAYAFEKLARYYCWRWQDSNEGASQGLVLRLDESTGSMPLSTLAETYDQIYTDLDDAIALFAASGIDRESHKVWIPNSNVAHAVYARTALARQDYEQALTSAKAAQQGFPLMSVADYKAGFCKNTSEWIMGSYGAEEETVWYWSYGTMYAANGYYASSTGTGAGTANPEMLDRIPNHDIRKGLFITPDKFPSFSMGMIDPSIGSFVGEEGDVDGLSQASWDTYKDIYTYINNNTPAGMTKAYEAGVYYMSQLKFWVVGQPGVGYLPFIRTSEMVLVEAEANYFLGKASDAQAALVKLNVSTERDPSYSVDKTGEDLFEEIVLYRNLELWGEGTSWSDYKRWNRPVVRKSIANGGGAAPAIAITIPADGVNKWTWDIPLKESDYNDEI